MLGEKQAPSRTRTGNSPRFAIRLDDVTGAVEDLDQAAAAASLAGIGVVRVPGRWPDRAAAWRAALPIAARAGDLDPICAGLPALEAVGEFTVPPPGVVQRDFHALHIDYGIPKLGGPPVTVSRFTALYLDPQQPVSGAATRMVPLRPLLGQRSWPAAR